MDRRSVQTLLAHAAAVAGRPPGGASDADLLARFVRDRDEPAFAELVRRHGRLVWAVCRNLLPSDADADDAFQATFLALVRNPRSVRDPGRLGPWLHSVAYRVSLKARRSATRRRERERTAAGPEADRPVPDSAWETALAAVHEEVDRLPEALRVPFVLCCLEGVGATDAAERLGWKLGTLSGRLTRAKQAVLARLTARGFGAGAAALAAVTVGVPPNVVARAAGLVRGPVSETILELSRGVLPMSVNRTKLLAAAVLVAGGLATTVGTGWLAPAGAQAPPPKPEAKSITDREVFNFYVGLFDQSPPASEYAYFVPKAPPDVLRFEAAIRDFAKRAGDGHQFVGVVRMSTDGLTAPAVKGRVFVEDPAGLKDLRVADVLVFKRPPQPQMAFVADATSLSEGELLMSFNVVDAGQPPADAKKAKNLEDQIKSLQAQLDQIRAKNRKDVTIPAAEVGIDPQEMMTFLGTLAKKRFGPGYRQRLGLSSTSRGLQLVGDAEAVDWAVDVVKKLNAK